jgi:hypothetical protein
VGGKPEDVVTGFPVGILSSSNGSTGGPLGLAFVNKNTLIVGGASGAAESGRLYVFNIGEPGSAAVEASQATQSLEIAADETQPALGSYYGICVTPAGVMVTTEGDGAQGWVAKASVTGNQLKDLARFVATVKDGNTSHPRALALSPEGYLAIGNSGEDAETPDSVLAFYDQDGAFLDRFPLGLRDVVGMAYSSSRKRLFVVDRSVADPGEGGLFKIVASPNAESRCTAQLIQKLHLPTALVFDSQGNLYVAQASTAEAEAGVPSGSVIKIIGLDLPPKPTTDDSTQPQDNVKEGSGG